MSVRTFDPAEVVLLVGGAPMSGFADGTFISVQRDEQMFNKVSGADGEVTRVKTNNRSGQLTITLAQSSVCNDILSGIAQADELSNSGVVPVSMIDKTGTTVLFCSAAWVQQLPETPFSKEVENREWVIELGPFTMHIGGNNLQGG